jgi:hypothetical protein
MAIVADITAVAGSTHDFHLRGLGPARVYITPRGGALTECVVSTGPDLEHLVVLGESSEFDGLAQDVTAAAFISAPIEWLRLEPAGATADIQITR